MNSKKLYILTPEQFAFMQAHHEAIENAMAPQFPDKKSLDWLDTFISSEAYKDHFGNMVWDDVYDRYDETPGYDNTLRFAIRKKLNENEERKTPGESE